jgi:transposase-like protein
MSDSCPRCNSKSLKRNGFTRHGKQNHRCLDCGKQFSTEPNVAIVVVAEDKVHKVDFHISPYTMPQKD